MELFVEHYHLNEEYKEAKKEFEKALAKKSQLLYSVVPKSANFENELVKGSSSNKFLNYTIKMEEIDKEINVRRNLRDVLEYRLKLKEIELNNSSNILDKVYLLKYVDERKVRYICIKTNYSKTQIYRILEEIKKKI
mgnify:CR=1 FL=1